MSHGNLLLEYKIPAGIREVDKEIFKYLSSKNVECRLSPRFDDELMKLTMSLQVEFSKRYNVFEVIHDMKDSLQDQFPEVKDLIFELGASERENRYTFSDYLKKTQAALKKKDSTGLADGVGGLAIKDDVSEAPSVAASVFLAAVEVSTSMLQLTGKIHLNKRVVQVEATNGSCAEFDISRLPFTAPFKYFLAYLSSSQNLGLNAPPERIYERCSDGTYCGVMDISCLKHEGKYNVFTEKDAFPVNPMPDFYLSKTQGSARTVAPNFSSMDEFYEKVGSFYEEDKSEIINILKEALEKQGIGLKYLPLLTDERLKEFGVKQVGIHIAVRMVLGQ